MPSKLDNIATYNLPNPDQQAVYQRLRSSAETFAGVIVELTQVGAAQTDAVRKVYEALMIANASISLNGKL